MFLFFLPTRIFTLDFIIQSLNLDQVHFLPRKHSALFKLKEKVGPFLVNATEAIAEIEIMLQEMKLARGDVWH